MKQIASINQRWEMGSEFAWTDKFTKTSQTYFPKHYELFATGTASLLSLIQLLQLQNKALRIHLPSFFCFEVAAKLATVCEVYWYRDLPTQISPDFHTLDPDPGDIVLAVNFFGIRTDPVWRNWLRQHQNCILVEDHSHDPFSDWARYSEAHYALASLRKTLPLPDGAMLWSPQHFPLPQPSAPPSKGADDKLTAMLLKRAYLKGADLLKERYRLLQMQGEQTLLNETGAKASDVTVNLLHCLDIAQLQQRRESNVQHFLDLSEKIDHPNWHSLFQSWKPGSVPFNSVIICQNQKFRTELRGFLASHNIFTAVHWQQSSSCVSHDSLAMELSNRILTIPADYRYTLDDIQYVINTISDFSLI